MVKNKMVFTMVIILLSILIIGIVALIVYFKFDNQLSGEPTIDEIVESTWQTEEITTNLNDNHIIRIQFQIQLDNKKAKNEIEKRDFQVNNTILNELSNMKAEDFNEKESLTSLEDRLQQQVNELLSDGEVTRVYTIQKIIQ